MGDAEESLYVVFIEDDPEIADMYRLKLEVDGYRVAVAPDGEAGLELVRKTCPDLIFLDIRLPRMDGFAVLEQLHRDPRTKDIPVVILSAYSEEELVERGLRLGALDYLFKSGTTPASLADSVPAFGKSRV